MGRYKGGHSDIGILNAGEEIVPNWMRVVKMEVGGRKTLLWNIPTNRRIYMFVAPFVSGGSGSVIVELGWRGLL